jgi:hypothetical protein
VKVSFVISQQAWESIAMKSLKWNSVASAVCVAGVVCVALAGTASAATVSSNVALFQPVSIASGEWDTLTVPLSVMTDDLNGSRVLTTSTESGLWVDLGQDYTIEKIYLGQKTNSAVAGAKLRAYAADQTTEIGTAFTVPSGSNYNYTVTDWSGVRWIKIADEGTKPTIMTDSLRELRAFAQVETYTGFISGVTATADSTYVGAPDVYVGALCNSAGMTDQRGPVGNPSAMSIASGPFWQTATDVLTATVTFNLNNSYDLDEMRIWNLNQANFHAERCTKHATIEYSTDGTNYTELADTNGAEDGNYTIPQIVNENAQNSYSLAIDLTGITANYVSITALDTYGTEFDPANCVGLSEVRFYGKVVSPTPIPGDTNNDGHVDATDAAVVADHWGAPVAANDYTVGNFNNDTVVDAADASILAANWTGSGESAAVPEPLSATLLASLLLAVAAVRPRRATR